MFTTRAAVIIATATLALVGCSTSEDGQDSSPVSGSVPAVHGYPKCPRVGEVITSAQVDGCTRAGELIIPGAHLCTDDRQLYADAGVYGYVGSKAKRGGPDDEVFAATYAACVSGTAGRLSVERSLDPAKAYRCGVYFHGHTVRGYLVEMKGTATHLDYVPSAETLLLWTLRGITFAPCQR